MMRSKLARVLDELIAEQVLDSAQRDQILGRMQAGASRSSAALIITVLASFGALLVAAGVLYLIGYHWTEFSPGVQLGIAGGFWLAVHAAAALCVHQPGHYPRVGAALELLAMLLFIGMVGLVAQIYHIDSEQPWAFLAWWACYLPLLLWRGSPGLLLVWTLAFLIWSLLQSHEWLRIRHVGAYANAGALYAVCGLGALFSALSLLSSTTARAGFQRLWGPLGSLGGFLGLYLLSFREAHWTTEPGWLKLVPSALASILAACALAAAWRRSAPREEFQLPMLLITLALCTPPILWHSSAWGPLIGNLITVGYLIFLAWRGVRTQRTQELNLSVALFALLVFTRYLEYLWDKLEGAYAFLATGALLLTLGWLLELRRRSLLRRMA
jgi:uncharacterized membrane protein